MSLRAAHHAARADTHSGTHACLRACGSYHTRGKSVKAKPKTHF